VLLTSVRLYKCTFAYVVTGGCWDVDVSLAGVMRYLRSLEQWEGACGFQTKDYVYQGRATGVS
jgi:hypothetical protein